MFASKQRADGEKPVTNLKRDFNSFLYEKDEAGAPGTGG